jgi:pimeloyl-ACP methyl ester carboxylesterase
VTARRGVLPWKRWAQVVAARLRAGGQVLNTDRGPIEYATMGTGTGPAVLVSHGTPGGYDQGLAVAEFLGCSRLLFIAVSRPGYLGTPLEVGRTPQEQADAFAALLDALGLRDAAVIGVSGGGPSAIQFALRHPDRCWTLVLISAITQNRPAAQRPLGWKLLHWAAMSSDLVGWLVTGLLRGVTSAISRQECGRARAELMRRLAAAVVPASLRRAGHANDSAQFGLLPDHTPGGITCPTLIIHGTADGPVPLVHAQAAAAAILNAELVAVSGGGHGTFFRSEGLASKVVEFLESHVQRA